MDSPRHCDNWQAEQSSQLGTSNDSRKIRSSKGRILSHGSWWHCGIMHHLPAYEAFSGWRRFGWLWRLLPTMLFKSPPRLCCCELSLLADKPARMALENLSLHCNSLFVLNCSNWPKSCCRKRQTPTRQEAPILPHYTGQLGTSTTTCWNYLWT